MFSARIANNGTASVTSQSSPFIDSVVRTATGFVTVDYTSLGLTESPSLSAVSELDLRDIAVGSVSSTSAIFTIRNTGSAVFLDSPFTFHLQRQGADYKAPKGFITGQFLRIQATSDGVEYKTHETMDGQAIFARSYTGTGFSNGTNVIDTIGTGLNILSITGTDDTGASYGITQFPISNAYNVNLYANYVSGTGVVNLIGNALVALNDVNFTIKYLKP